MVPFAGGLLVFGGRAAGGEEALGLYDAWHYRPSAPIAPRVSVWQGNSASLAFSLHEEEDGLVWLPLLLFLLQPNNIGVPSILHGTELKPEVEYLY